jgi:uncharacterized membrane protein YvlD (DUF360 family)
VNSLIGRIVIAVVVAVVVGLILVALLGPILVSLNVPIADVVGGFFVKYGWVLGVLAGLWSFFAGGFSLPGRTP